MNLSRFLYRLARASRDVDAIQRTAKTGNPTYAVHRAKNKVVGRVLRRVGFWRRLWG